jgi:hypothetical protein
MSKLNKWDNYLSSYWMEHLDDLKNKKHNSLVIGTNEGKKTCWLLNNLSNNPETRVYSVDTWMEGNPEYSNDVDQGVIEKIFDENIKKTNRVNQLIKLKMPSKKALNYLIDNKIKFDYIYLDSSIEAKNVITDAILSWELLIPCGRMIFDDYEWDKSNEEYYRPKLAIDSFVKIFKPELKVLFVDYQYGIEKICYDKFEKKYKTEYCAIMNKINKIEFNNLSETLQFDIPKNSLEVNLETITERFNFINENTKNLFNKICKLINKYEILNKSFFENKKMDATNKLLPIFDILHREGLTWKSFYHFIDMYDILHSLSFLKKTDDISCYILNRTSIDDSILNLIKKKYQKNISINYYSDKSIKSQGIEMYLEPMKNKKKYDSVCINLGTKNGATIEIFKNSHNYNANIIMSLILCLNIQNNDGVAFFKIPVGFDEITIQFIYILKMYYKNVIIKNLHSSKISLTIGIHAVGFMGISDDELNNFNSSIEYFEKNSKLFGNNNKNLCNFVNLNKNDVNYGLIKIFLLKFENDKHDEINNIINILVRSEIFINDKSNKSKEKKNIENNLLKNNIQQLYNYLYDSNF